MTLLGLVACDPNAANDRAAQKFGDLSHPATRGSPVDELNEACGPGTMTPAGSVVHRRPYLQQVTPTSIMVGWVSVSTTTEQIDITTIGGDPVTTAVGELEDVGTRSVGERQMWARIGGLSPDTIYCYALSSDAPLSERTGFRTAPEATSEKPIHFLAFGDSGGGNADQRALRDHMFEFPYELMIHTGDLAYDAGTIDQLEDTVFQIYYELLRNIPLFPAAGNHDEYTDGGAPFRDVFALPGGGDEKWYSYDWGRIHFVALDTEASYVTQAAWLDDDLAASPLPWKIVYLHRPLYSSGPHGSDLPLRAALAPVLEKHHVQLVLTGHDHDYERMIPQNDVAYVVTGGGGRGTYDVGSSSFTAFSEAVIHFVYVEVSVDELVLHAIDGTGVEFDSLVVPR